MIAFVGDGGFAMLMAEFLTAVRHELPIKVFINNNSAYGQILWEQMVLGYPEFGVRQQPFADYAPWARACGAFGEKVDRPGTVPARSGKRSPTLARRSSTSTSTRTSRRCRARSRYDQAKAFAEAFLRGQPHKADHRHHRPDKLNQLF